MRVVDGDTVDVSSGLWSTTRVRLLNVDAPETVDPSRPVECLGFEASQRLKQLLPEGSPVDLAFDVEGTDRYGRTLAGVYANGELVNAQLASEGLAVPATVGSNTKFRDGGGRSARLGRRLDCHGFGFELISDTSTQRTDCRRVQCWTVQRALGHTTATTTLSTYAHLWPTAEDPTRRAAAGLMRAAMGIPADPLGTAGT